VRNNLFKMLSTGLVITLLLSACQFEKSNQKPNIIFILADDLGYGDLSCYGQIKFSTPNIDKLAAEGIRFTQHYAGSTVCAPSRCALMTGLHTGNAQIRGNREIKPEGQAPMKAGTVMISNLLDQAGYATGMFGKWGLGSPGSESDPALFFDEFYGYNCQREAHTYYPNHLWHNRKKVTLDGKTYSHDLIMKAAMDFIQTNKDKPFFCYMPVTIPHAAMHAPKELHDKYRYLYPQFENEIGQYAGTEVENPVAAFAAMVEHLDNGVGQIMRLVKDLGIDDRTIVMFTSDNGPHREGGHDPDFWDSNGNLRGIKRDLYEQTQHEYLYWEFTEKGGKQAIRKENFKAIKLEVLKDPDAAIMLFDLDSDPGESRNIANQYPQIIDEMRLLFHEARTESPEFPLFKK